MTAELVFSRSQPRRWFRGAERAGTLALLLATVLVLAAPVSQALAHPLGNFSVNRYSRIEVGPEQARLRYVLDLAEIPTLQTLRAHGLDPATIDQPGLQLLLVERAAELMAGARLEVDGQWVEWKIEEPELQLLPGQANLATMRITLTLASPLVVTNGARLSYRDANEPGRAGWHELVLRGVDGLTLAASGAPSEDLTDELRRYPDDPTLAPLDLSGASATAQLLAGSGGPSGSQAGASLPAGRGLPLTPRPTRWAASCAMAVRVVSSACRWRSWWQPRWARCTLLVPATARPSWAPISSARVGLHSRRYSSG